MIAVYESLRRKWPKNSSVWKNLAYLLAQNDERLAEVLECVGTAAAQDPDAADYLDTYGYLLYRKARYVQAAQSLVLAVRKYEGDPKRGLPRWLAIGGATTFLGKETIMPSVHYGRLPDDDLMDLWQSETCQFYRQRFEHRVQRYDDVIVRRLLGSSGSNRLKTLQAAEAAMPAAPKGCNVCHYLYDI